jgi:phytoene synthase
MSEGTQTGLNASRADLDEVESLVRAAATSFYRGMAVLPLPRRQAMYAIYAFCRIVDDIADDEVQFAEKAPRLEAWRGRIAALYAQGRADEAVTRVLRPAIAAYGLREADFLAVVDGMAMDAAEPIVAPDVAALDLYCDRVAAAVGRLSVRAFGDASPAADEVAHHLGRALQMTNILRDIGEDGERGRLYLPREDLEAEGVPTGLPEALASPNLPRVAGRLADRAEAHFAAAEEAMRHCEQTAMKPARLMAATYAATLRRVRRAGWRDLHRRVGLPVWEKLYIALRFGIS